MELIKKLPREKATRGYMISVALFKCPRCFDVSKKILTKGKSQKTCGCYKREVNGESKTKLYGIWSGMKNRCNNTNDKRYMDYGGRGIVICNEWERSFLVFKNWAIKNGYKEGVQIDRRDNDWHYHPSNCRFVTSAQNSRNRRNNKLNWLKVDAIRDLRKTGVTTRKLADLFGVYSTMVSRIVANKAWVYKNGN